MFTNEFLPKKTVTTVLDETDSFDDVKLHIGQEVVYIEQYNESCTDVPEMIIMTPEMFQELLDAMKCGEGLFKSNRILKTT